MTDFKKGNGSKVDTNTQVAVLPINIGKGLKWDEATGKYNIDLTPVKANKASGLELKENGSVGIKLSNREGNLLQLGDDGLYYGIKPAKNLRDLYIDAVNGIDQHPDEVEGAGTKAKPLRTIKYADKISLSGTSRTYWLHTEQEHIQDVSEEFGFTQGYILMRPYGSAFDEANAIAEGDHNEAYIRICNNGKAPIIKFTGLETKEYPPFNPRTTHPDFNCWSVYGSTQMEFHGCRFENKLDYTLTKHPKASTYEYRGGHLSRTLFRDGATAVFNRCKFSSYGLYKLDSSIVYPSSDDGLKMFTCVEGKRTSIAGFLHPSAGRYSFIHCMIDPDMTSMMIADKGWGYKISAGTLYAIDDNWNMEDKKRFAKRVFGVRRDSISKAILAPATDTDSSLFEELPRMSWEESGDCATQLNRAVHTG